jgi:hypothetical protein
LYRPGTVNPEDTQMAAAIDFAKNDPELSRWFKQHQIFQEVIQAKLRQIEPLGDLKHILLAREKVFLPGRLFWRRPLFLSAAAAVVIFVAALAALSPHKMAPDRFGNYREVMVSKALRGYIMEWETKDMRRLRELVAGRKALANYELTKGLRELQLMGGAVFPWRSNPVTMVCFSRRDGHMIFLCYEESSGQRRSTLEPDPGKGERPFDRQLDTR